MRRDAAPSEYQPGQPIDAVRLEPDELESRRLRQLLAHWESLKSGKAPPPRSRLDPTSIGYILAQVILLEVRRDPLDFYIRLVGTATESAGHAGYQGRMLGEVEPKIYQDLVRRHYEEVVASRSPTCYRVQMVSDIRQISRPPMYERIILPLAGERGEVDYLLVGSDWPAEWSRGAASQAQRQNDA